VQVKYFNQILLVSSFIICCEGLSFSQEQDYKTIFGKDWDKAQRFVNENEDWMKRASEEYNISFQVAVAVVFPELIRYSALRDKIEITLLKSLYTYKGEDYADFSIGQFQMKPSFAESVLEKVLLLKGRLRNQIKEKIKQDDIIKYRSAIVRDLEEPESQFLYLAAFLKICEAVYNLKDMNDGQRIRFLSTAYNYSFQKSFEEINTIKDKKFFYTTLVKTESYCYADISWTWYDNYLKNR
jgi:hypothetical protein